jgi:adenylate cyclase
MKTTHSRFNMISLKSKRIILRILSFGLVCAFFGFIFALIEKGLLGDLEEFPVTGSPYDFKDAIIIYPIGAFILGLIIGGIEMFFLEKRFLKISFLVKLLAKSSFYLLIISLFFYIITIVNSSFGLDLEPWHQDVLEDGAKFFGNSLHLALLAYAGGIIMILLFLFEVTDYLGQGIIINYMTGKYHAPKEEERIFMFLDMKSSTSIAEKLGHIKYFKLLQNYYADMTNSIESYSGKVYQYVGDEIVVSWDLDTGIKNNNCLECFFSLKKTFDKLTKSYEKEFGLTPKFKAALHYGSITTGEIGILKKEIFFTGDALNTTSRMEKLCNVHNVDCLISKSLLSRLKGVPKLSIKSIGEHLLRGKENPIELYAISY